MCTCWTFLTSKEELANSYSSVRMVIRERLTNGQEKSNFFKKDFLTSWCHPFVSVWLKIYLDRLCVCVSPKEYQKTSNENFTSCVERCVCGCGGEIRHHPLLGRLLLFKTQSIDNRQSIHQATTRRAFLLLLPGKTKKVNVTRMCITCCFLGCTASGRNPKRFAHHIRK
jgi:hypothetical protein